MNIVITMAGAGVRFQQAGFGEPKHMISVGGKTLFEWSLSSLRNFFDHKFIFVSRAEHDAKAFIQEKCAKIGCGSVSVIELGAPTAGQAETVLQAADLLADSAEDLLIFNIDTFVRPRALGPGLIRGMGWLPSFVATGDHWSFVRFDDDCRVLEVTEKIRISEFATIGLYYFKSFSLFQAAFEKTDYARYRERYIAPLYSALLQDPKTPVYTTVIKSSDVHVLGTPEELTQFQSVLTNAELFE